MRRDELIAAIESVRKALQHAEIHAVVQALMRPGSKEQAAGSGIGFQAYATFMIAYSNFGSAEKAILEALKLIPITKPVFWNGLTSKEREDRLSDDAVHARQGAILARDFLPAIEQLLRRTTDTVTLTFEDIEKSGQPVEARRIKFFIREPGDPSLTVKHLARIMESIESLHSALSTIHDLPPSELVVGSMDSGSDKEFDLLGIAKAIKILSDTLLECWNRYRSAKAWDTSVSYKTALEGISVLEKLQHAQKNNSVSAETAESLRRTIVKSIDDLFSNGVYTDGMEAQPNIIPSALPVERRKLLTHRPLDEVADVVAEEPPPKTRRLNTSDEDE
jgi:hypothetical protein